jgi:hypothetical protein
VLYVTAADGIFDQRCALALNDARTKLMRLSLDEFKALVREQFCVLLLEPERSVAAIASLVPDVEGGDKLLRQVRAIVGAAGAPAPAERDRIAQLAEVLRYPREQPSFKLPQSEPRPHKRSESRHADHR